MVLVRDICLLITYSSQNICKGFMFHLDNLFHCKMNSQNFKKEKKIVNFVKMNQKLGTLSHSFQQNSLWL